MKATGSTWEGYYQTQEKNPAPTVSKMLFRASGTAVPANSGNGFLIDNLTLPRAKTDHLNDRLGQQSAEAANALQHREAQSTDWASPYAGASACAYSLHSGG